MTMQVSSSLSIHELVQQQLGEFQKYPSWHGALSSQEAKAVLAGKSAFTYIVCAGADDSSYRLTWVTDKELVSEKDFHLEHDSITGKPFYRNGTTFNFPAGVMAEIGQIGLLLSRIMGCDEYQMSPLSKT